jgi:single-stranded DNA-binding protein
MSAIEAAFFGALGRDGELKTSKGGTQYLRLNIRVGDGDQAQWVSVTSFDPDAIAMSEKFTKGSRCYVEGSLRLDQWAGPDGATRHGLSVLSRHTRLAAIGRARKRNKQTPATTDFRNEASRT